MNVKILKVSTDKLVGATIRKGERIELPSIQTGWRFNFGSRLMKLSYATAYVLVDQDTPDLIEGTLIFQMQDKTIPYMAYVEVAPHNRTDLKKYDYVAGCLIAFACKQSFIRGKGDYQGWLTFDVCEENEKDQIRLMTHYCTKYKAQRFADTTTMIIDPENGRNLIEEYLERKA
ncbi:hypothetical protein SAMN05518672_104714 [Chitinophaga sp. CF118]|uniref:hypothetical protein n=1 Tax=Chitinophaga sp. CF118 TaxID=1884367 RepID=UPI0008E67C43|nr:hypothetical protein [Chitinophaga sp. CF118]SFE16189.1 hypothetical protein SAMN05518672_104714 [Chitinophaga sp. CF118]